MCIYCIRYTIGSQSRHDHSIHSRRHAPCQHVTTWGGPGAFYWPRVFSHSRHPLRRPQPLSLEADPVGEQGREQGIASELALSLQSARRRRRGSQQRRCSASRPATASSCSDRRQSWLRERGGSLGATAARRRPGQPGAERISQPHAGAESCATFRSQRNCRPFGGTHRRWHSSASPMAIVRVALPAGTSSAALGRVGRDCCRRFSCAQCRARRVYRHQWDA